MAYADTIDGLKKALELYSQQEVKLTELYEAARKNAAEQHKQAQKDADAAYLADRNRIASDSAREESNYFQFLASRGLGKSGEAAHAKLETGLGLNSALAALSRDKIQNDQKLDLDNRNAMLKLGIEEAKEKSDLNQKAIDAQAKLADIEAEYKSVTNNYYGSSGGSNSSGSSSGGGSFVPSTSAKEMAKQIVGLVTNGKSKLTDNTHIYKAKEYIDELREKHGVDEGYIKNLIICLEALGYVNDLVDNGNIHSITNNSYEYYEEQYYKLLSIYRNLKTESEVRKKASELAKDMQLTYIYTHSTTMDEFRSCCAAAGFGNGQVEKFLLSVEEVRDKGGKFELGSYVK